MKKILVSIILSSIAILSAHSQQLKEWQDHTVVEVNKETPRSYFMSYQNRELAVQNVYEESEWFIQLNGTWDFRYFSDYRKAPVDSFYRLDFPTTSWDSITVPGNWECQGHGVAIYTNHPYEFATYKPQPPTLPDAVPVGLYRRTFEVPLRLLDRDVFLCMDGVKSGATVYINGKKVGYTEDSKSRAEFLINDYIVEGENLLAVEVMRWSTGSYLECQDFWRISGFERDVYVWSQPAVRITDYRVEATLDSTYTDGVFNLEMALQNSFVRPSGGLQVWYEIENAQGELVDYSYAEIEMQGNSLDTVRFTRTLRDVEQWSAEQPNLYTLILKIKQDGRFIEYVGAKIGFRTTEVVGRDYLVNGKRVLLKGVNYHEHDEETGHYLKEETIIKDMELMKQANINAIRLSHYPQGRRFYELADKYGFYIVNEANIESHGMYYDLRRGGTLGNNPEWLTAHMERTVNMYEQSKNHPSVVIWSLGNEAGNGYNFYETYLYLKGVDSLRPVQYERSILEWNTDIYCPQYPSAEYFRIWNTYNTDRPYIPSEYLHSMGNSTGGMKDMWNHIYGSDKLQGGFIWDWVDQGLLEYNQDTTNFAWTYGGDYKLENGEPAPSDGNFLCNGLVNPDRTPHPALLGEVKKVHQYVHFDSLDTRAGLYTVKNYYDFNSLDKYNIKWTIRHGEKAVKSGTVALSTQPQALDTINIGTPVVSTKPGVETFVEFSVELKDKEPLLPKGYKVAGEQFLLSGTTPKTQYTPKNTKAIEIEGTETDIELVGSNFSLSIDRKTGFLKSYTVNAEELIADGFGLRPNFWRAATDNDYGSQMPHRAEMWRKPSQELTAWNVNTTRNENQTVTVTAKYALPETTALNITYTVYTTGIVHIGYHFMGNPQSDKLIPRLGMRMRLPEQYSTLEYFGRGPQENYQDRNYGTEIGLYTSDAGIEAFHYVRPQETGHHTDTRYLTLTKNRGRGLAVIADNTMEFNALRNSVEDFDAEGEIAKKYPYQWTYRHSNEDHSHEAGYGKKPRHTHTWDIVPQPYVELSLDYKQMGVGGDDSWGSLPYTQYRVQVKDSAEWGFTLVPVKNKAEAAKLNTYKY